MEDTQDTDAPTHPTTTFAVAFFNQTSDNAPKQQHLTLDELGAVLTNHSTRNAKDGPLFSPALYRPGTPRKAENVQAVSALVFDFDGDADPIEVTRQLDEQGLCYLIYTTWSHTRAAPKFRVVIPLAMAVAGEQWQDFYRRAALHYGQGKADPKCKDASRIFYLPSCPPEVEADAWSFYQPGECLLHSADVPTSTPTARPAARQQAPATATGELRPYVRAILTRELDAVRNAPNGHRNDTLNRAAFALGTIVGAGELNAAQVEANLLDAASAAGLPEDEARATVRSGVAAGQTNPRTLPTPQAPQQQQAASNSHAQTNGRPTAMEPPSAPDFSLDEIGNGQRFTARHGHDLRFCSVREQWQHYSAGRWQPDEHGEAERRAKQTGRDVTAEAAREANDDKRARLLKHAITLTKRATRETMLKDAASEPGMMVTPEMFDCEPHLLNVRNGVIDLRTFEFRPHNSGLLLSKQAGAAFNPNVTAPTWSAALELWMPDAEARDYLQDTAGLSLSGEVPDEFFNFICGPGENGKSTFLRTLEQLAGSYTHRTPAETLMLMREQRRAGAPAPELVALQGARLVTVAEVDKSHRLSTALVRDLTGRDKISARGVFAKRAIEFQPQFTLWLNGNHRPRITDGTHGMWRRVRVLEFTQQITAEQRDSHLGDKLRRELPGILNWALEGLRRVQQRGLIVPASVQAATDEYRAEQDTFAGFLSNCCTTGPKCEATAAQLWRAWCAWCSENGEREGTQRALGLELKRRNFKNEPKRDGVKWFGVGLLANQQHEL